MKKLSQITESIWSDIQDRSAGDTVRKEDFITTNEDLRNKIQELYKEQGEGETLDVSSLTKLIKCDDFSNIFEGYPRVKQIIGLEDWDVSNVKNMTLMFWGCINFNANLSNWDVSNVENMSCMFKACEKFNCDLSKWDVSHVQDMDGMFVGCKKFNSDLSNWDVSNVENMPGMFYGCKKFNSDLSKWNVSSVGDMNEMFEGCEKFNSDLSNWNVKGYRTFGNMFGNMFDNCKSLEQIPSWYKINN